jgi:hypothetical protein
MRAEKQATRGLVFIASFVWQKAMNFGSGANSYDNVGDPNNVRPNKGVADYNRISEFSLGHTYQLPLGPGQHFLRNAKGVAKQIVSGWSFNGVTTARSGLPLTPTVSSKATLNGATWSLRPDPVSSNFYAATKTRNQWFNVAAFAVPGLYRQGYLGRATLRGPGFFEADWALSKDFPLTEKVKLQFRWESFNAFNNTNMANPGTTIDTPAGGVITDVIMPMRQMQWGLRLSW